MTSWWRAHVTYANVVATLALFVALGGTSFAALRIGSEQIRDQSIRGKDIRAGAVAGKQLRAGAVAEKQLRAGAVAEKQLRTGAVTARQLRDGAVTTRHVAPDTLTGAQIAPESLGSGDVANLLGSDFAPGQLPDPLPLSLPRGKRLVGTFGVTVTGQPSAAPAAGSDGDIARAAISFPVPLAGEPNETYVREGTGPTPGCPGSPANPVAAPGNFCLYEAARSGEIAFRGIFHPVTGENFQASRFGAIVFVNGEPGAAVRGTWAVTAP